MPSERAPSPLQRCRAAARRRWLLAAVAAAASVDGSGAGCIAGFRRAANALAVNENFALSELVVVVFSIEFVVVVVVAAAAAVVVDVQLVQLHAWLHLVL